MCCAESGRSLGELSLFLLRPLQTELLCQLGEEIRVGIDLIQKKIILCSVTFCFSRGINLFVHYGLPGIWDLLLGAGFLQPGSLHSHFSSCSPVLWQPQPDGAMPLGMQGCSSSPLERKLQPCFPRLPHAAQWLQLAEPFSLSHLRMGLVQPARPGLAVVRIPVGWAGANYPVLTRVRPARALAVHTDAFPASCAG